MLLPLAVVTSIFSLALTVAFFGWVKARKQYLHTTWGEKKLGMISEHLPPGAEVRYLDKRSTKCRRCETGRLTVLRRFEWKKYQDNNYGLREKPGIVNCSGCDHKGFYN